MKNYITKNKIWRKIATIAILYMYSLNAIPCADVSLLAVSTLAGDSMLAPGIQLSESEFREKFTAKAFLLAHEAVNGYIREQLKKEERIFGRIKSKIADIEDTEMRGNIDYNVDGLSKVVFVSVTGLLVNTGQFAHVGLSGRDYDNIPVVYIDSQLYNEENMIIQRHEIDEILQWEDLRVNVLKLKSGGMRSWIKKHITTPDPKLKNTRYYNLSSRDIAKKFHHNSYPLDTLYVAYIPEDFFQYHYIIDLLDRYGYDSESDDINIAGARHLDLLDEQVKKVMRWIVKPDMKDSEVKEMARKARAYLEEINKKTGADKFFELYFKKNIIVCLEDLDLGRKYSVAAHVLDRINSLKELCLRNVGPKEKLLIAIFGNVEKEKIVDEYIETGSKKHALLIKQLKDRRLWEKTLYFRYLPEDMKVSKKSDNEKKIRVIKNVVNFICGENEILQNAVFGAVEICLNGTEDEIEDFFGLIQRFNMKLEKSERLMSLHAPPAVIVGDIAEIRKRGRELSLAIGKHIPNEIILRTSGNSMKALPSAEYEPLIGEDINYQEWAKEIILSDKGFAWLVDRRIEEYCKKNENHANLIPKIEDLNSGQKLAYFYALSNEKRRMDIAKKVAAKDEACLEVLVPFLKDMTSQDIFKILPSRLAKERPNPLIGRTIDYKEWLNRVVVSGDKEGFISDLANYVKNGGNLSFDRVIDLFMEINLDSVFLGEKFSWIAEFELFYKNFNNADKLEVSKAIFQRLNSGNFDKEILPYIYYAYDFLVEPYPRRVNLLTNPKTALELYNIGARDFRHSAMEYRQDYDERVGREALSESAKTLELRKEKLTRFFIYNPSPELLKGAVCFWNSQLSFGAPERRNKGKFEPGQKIKLINDRELNTLNWIIHHIPKDSNSRDNRRRLHNYIRLLTERRMQREDDPVCEFMSDAVLYMNTGLADKQAIKGAVLAFVDFAVVYTNLPKYIQRNSCKKMHLFLEELITVESEGKKRKLKLALVEEHYLKIKDKLIEFLLEEIFSQAVILTTDEIALIQKSIAGNHEAWFRDDLFISLARYYGFQTEEGKKAVEKYFLVLAKSKVEGDRFKNLPRYEWNDPEWRKIFGENLISAIQKGYSQSFDLPKDADNLKDIYYEIWNDILAHLDIKGLSPEERIKSIRETFREKGCEDKFDGFWEVFTNIEKSLKSGRAISLSAVAKWKKAMEKTRVKEVFTAGEEVFVNLDQIIIVQEKRVINGNTSIEFIITEEPYEFIKSAERPYYTCQRIVERTNFNQNGEPVRRAGHGQFFLAQIKINGNIEARSILEIAVESKDNSKVLLVERIYKRAGVSSRVFQQKIIDWAISTGEIKYIVFSGADFPKGMTELIQIKTFPVDGSVYRDTKWARTVRALDLYKYQKKMRKKMPVMETAKVSFASSRVQRAPVSRQIVKEDDIKAQNSDIENMQCLFKKFLSGQVLEGRIYEIRYDKERLQHYQIRAGIQNAFSPEKILIRYVNLLKVRAKDSDSIQLLPCSGGKTGLFTVTCYDKSGKRKIIGEGKVDIEGTLDGQALRIAGLLNMALAVSNIRKDTAFSQMNDYEKELLQFVKDQCKALTDIDVPLDEVIEFIKLLPPAKPFPIGQLEEYYKASLKQIERAA